MNKYIKTTSLVTVAPLLLLGIQVAQAAGFYLNELGTPSSTGMAGVAGVAKVTNNFSADAAGQSSSART